MKTIPVISGREFWIEFGGDPSKDGELYKRYCASHEFKPATYAEEVIHCAEVTGSIQLDDLKKLIQLIEELGDGKIVFPRSAATEALTVFRRKYSNLLKEGE